MSTTQSSPEYEVSQHSNVRIVSFESSGKGKGLIAEKDINLKEKILQIDKPLITALSVDQLPNICYHCCSQRPAPIADGGGEPENKTDAFVLRICTGCKVARYCGPACQKASWNSGHKYECKTLRDHHPRVMPTIMRAMILFLVTKSKGLLSEAQWSDCLGCPSHIGEFATRSNDEFLGLAQMSQVTRSYVQHDPKFILEMYCRMKINAMSLMTPWFDPLGICMDPFLAKINHSCQPNAFVFFAARKNRRPVVQIMPIRPILKGEEITISYIEENKSLQSRQLELKDRYFFACDCFKCDYDEKHTRGMPDHSLNSEQRAALKSIEELSTTLPAPSSPSDKPSQSSAKSGAQLLITALRQLAKAKVPKHLYPFPQTTQNFIVSLIDIQRFDYAMLWAFIQVLDIDPLVYKKNSNSDSIDRSKNHPKVNSNPHPIEIVHLYTLLRLINFVIDDTTTTTFEEQFHNLPSSPPVQNLPKENDLIDRTKTLTTEEQQHHQQQPSPKSRLDFQSKFPDISKDDLIWWRHYYANKLLQAGTKLYPDDNAVLKQIRRETFEFLPEDFVVYRSNPSATQSVRDMRDRRKLEDERDFPSRLAKLRKTLDLEYGKLGKETGFF